jgi:hypothetical protein
VSQSEYPSSIWLSSSPGETSPNDDTAWLDEPELSSDVKYIRADKADEAFQSQLLRVRKLSAEREIAMGRIAALETEKCMLAEAIKMSHRRHKNEWNLPLFKVRRLLREFGYAI